LITTRSIAAAAAALLLVGCAHPLEIRNLDQYRSLARGDPLERQTVIGLIATAPDPDSLRLVNSVGAALGKYSARVIQPYTVHAAAETEVLARVAVTPQYQGSGSNWFVNFPGLLVLAPTWNGYAYTVGYEFQVLLTRAWDNAKLDSFTVPVSLDVRHSSGMLLSADYNPEVTEPAVDQGGEPVADYVAREIVRHLNTDGRLWKLTPPSDWVPPQPPPPPPRAAPAPAPVVPPAAAPVVPAPALAKPAPPVAPAVPKVLATGGLASLRAGGVVRNRPTTAGEAVAIGAGPLRLGSGTLNAFGRWWYVSAGGKAGWALDKELAPAAAAPAPAPAATAPVAPIRWAAGHRAQLRAGAAARTRMALDGDVAKGIEPGAMLTLKTRVARDNGVWWYVISPAGSGWVLESELAPAP